MSVMRKMTVRLLESASRLYGQGKSQRMIADSLGISRGTLCYWMGVRPDMFPPRERMDSKWWRGKLADVEGLSDSAAARKLGCNRRTVWKWRRLLDDAR